MIKNVKPNKNTSFKQGYYILKEGHKYVGKGPIIYRSSLEQKFCDYCENNKQIKKWSSENVEIKYFDTSDGKEHRYYPDFLVVLEEGLTLLVEVKPSSHIRKPEPPKKKTKKSLNNYSEALETYRINMLKFNAAVKYCADRGWVFRIITEEFFEKKK